MLVMVSVVEVWIVVIVLVVVVADGGEGKWFVGGNAFILCSSAFFPSRLASASRVTMTPFGRARGRVGPTDPDSDFFLASGPSSEPPT